MSCIKKALFHMEQAEACIRWIGGGGIKRVRRVRLGNAVQGQVDNWIRTGGLKRRGQGNGRA